MENKIGQIPEFTADESVETGKEEVKETPAEEAAVEEKETPTEPPAEDKPAEETPKEEIPVETSDDDTKELKQQVQGLEGEKEKLLKEIQALRGSRRELKKEELAVVDKKIQQASDELKDLHPEDVSLIDRVLRAKGYITKGEASQMAYNAIKTEEVDKFLEKFPEYKPDNDPNDVNWNALQRQIGTWYRMPEDPRLIGELLAKAHRDIAKAPSGRDIEIKKQQVRAAGSGSFGVQRSSAGKSLTPEQRQTYRDGGWSEEEIKQIEKNLPE